MAREISRSEFSILRSLWKQQPQSTREVHDSLGNSWAYTTTKTMMDRMVAKGLLTKSTVHGVFVYRPAITRPEGVMQFVRFFADKILERDYEKVVGMFADSDTYTPAEIEELRNLLQRQENGVPDDEPADE